MKTYLKIPPEAPQSGEMQIERFGTIEQVKKMIKEKMKISIITMKSGIV